MEYVTLVDLNDRRVGTAEKLEAHRRALLHRACSVVLMNTNGELLLQQRHPEKYHSGGLWSNACCTHPRPDETPLAAAVRRLREEMGIEAELEPLFSFVYQADLDNGLVEHEYDHVFIGNSDREPRPNGREVLDWRWASVPEIADDLEENPALYTEWFPLILKRLEKV